MQETKKEWYFIVNPRAGSGKTMSQWVPAEKKLDIQGFPYVTAYTDHKRHATTLAYEAAQEGYRKILAVGGDGSLHEVFGGIIKWCDQTGTDPSEFYLGVAPIGSGNDWIKSFRIPHDVDSVLELIEKESFGRMDVVRVDSIGGKTSYMANIGGIGFDSHVCKRVNLQKESGMRNKMIYLNALRYTIFHIKPINVKLIADDKEIFSGQCYSIALGNGKYSGSGMRQVPLADPDDGLLDVMVVTKCPITTLLKQMPRLFNGSIHESQHVVYAKCRNLQVIPMDNESNDIIELDGEIEGRLPVSFNVTGRKINVVKGGND